MFYLLGSIALLFFFAIVLLVRSDLRKQSLILAAICMPLGPITEVIYFRDYWTYVSILPKVTIMGYSFFIEDLLFGFVAAGIMSICYDFFLHKKPLEQIYKPRLRQAIVISIFQFALFIVLSLTTRINSIFLTSFCVMVAMVPILYLRRDLTRCALISGLICGLGAFIFYFLILLIPGAIEFLLKAWKLSAEYSSLHVLGLPIPLTEILWAFSQAFYFGVIYKFCVGSGYKESGEYSLK